MSKEQEKDRSQPGNQNPDTVDINDPNQREALLQQLGEAYHQFLDDNMGLLHNQFVGFIAESRLPLPQVTLVLEMLLLEVKLQARKKYLGSG